MDRGKIENKPGLPAVIGHNGNLRGKMKLWFRKTEPFFSVVLWCLAIFYFSNIPGSGSGFKDIAYILSRKSAHIFEYLVLMFLTFRAAKLFTGNKKSALFGAVIFSFLYAFSDEAHQIFIRNRDGRTIDIVIDGLGIFIAFIVLKKRNKL